jgi:hypothetical protein
LVEQSPLKRTVVGSNPTGRTWKICWYAEVAKLADALALGASGVIHGGSSPLPSTIILKGFPFYEQIIIVDVTRRTTTVDIGKANCAPNDVENPDSLTEEQIERLPLAGGGFVTGSVDVFWIPDHVSGNRLKLFVQNQSKNQGDNQFVEERLKRIDNYGVDRLGRLCTWLTLATSARRINLWFTKQFTKGNLTPANIHEKGTFLRRHKPDGPVDASQFEELMALHGFPDNKALGIRIIQFAPDLEGPEDLQKLQEGVAKEKLERDKQLIDIETKGALVAQLVQRAKEVLGDGKVTDQTWREAELFVLSNLNKPVDLVGFIGDPQVGAFLALLGRGRGGGGGGGRGGQKGRRGNQDQGE